LKRFLEGALLTADEAHVYWNGTFSSQEKRALWVRQAPSGRRPAFLDVLDSPHAPGEIVNRYLWFDQLRYLPDDILYKCDRVSMAHSLEVRPPFLDHRIVEFAASLPPRFKVRGRCLKWILRELMKDKLPPEVIQRRKEGLDIPVHEWLRGPLREILLDTLNSKTVSELGALAWEPVGRCLTRHLERRANLGYHLWGLMTLVLWFRTWKIRPAREAVQCHETQEPIATRRAVI
jgi:asparagine synthase (glutamine-hydrolysing)